ncbi:hypothetical protein FI667_g12153, partial [Globisporangium splendens]
MESEAWLRMTPQKSRQNAIGLIDLTLHLEVTLQAEDLEMAQDDWRHRCVALTVEIAPIRLAKMPMALLELAHFRDCDPGEENLFLVGIIKFIGKC